MFSRMNRNRCPLVSIIILNYNGKHFLEDCLTSVLQTKYSNFEIIFVDNGSINGSVEYVKEIVRGDTRIKIIQNLRNLGFAEGNNVALRRVRGDYVVFLNNDTKVDPDWLVELLQFMESNPNVGIAQTKLLSYYNSRIINSMGGIVDKYGFAVDRGMGEVDRGQYDKVEEIFSACLAATIVRKRIFNEIGLLDPAFFAVFEDVDICWRARCRGYKVMLVPSSIVYHRGGGTAKISGNMLLYYLINFHLYKNRLSMMIKNYSLRNLVKRMPVTLLLHALTFVKYMFIKRDMRLALAVLKSYFWIILNIKYLIHQRRLCQKIRRVPDNEIEKLMQKLPLTLRFCQEKLRDT